MLLAPETEGRFLSTLWPAVNAPRYEPAGERHGGVRLDGPFSWMTQGACLSRQEIDWFPSGGDTAAAEAATAVCRACAVQERCLDHAVTRHEYGIWGGATERDRDRLRLIRRTPPTGALATMPPGKTSARIVPFE